MTTREIVEKALSLGLIAPGGKTPEKSLDARLYLEQKRPDLSRFMRLHSHGPTRAARGSVRWTLRER